MTSIIKRLSALAVIAVCCISCHSTDSARLAINIPDLTEALSLTLYLSDGTEMEIPVDATGAVTVYIDVDVPQYAYLHHRFIERILWLTPDTDISISFNDKEYHQRLNISGRKGVAENVYLNSGLLKPAYFDDRTDTQEKYMAFADETYAANLALLYGAGLNKEFTEKEIGRLKYFTHGQLMLFRTYVLNNNPDAAVDMLEDKIAELTVYDGSLTDSRDYRNFILDVVRVDALKEYPELSGMDAIIRYVEEKIDDDAVCEYIINEYIVSAVSRRGLEVAEHYKDVFFKYVKSQCRIDAFGEACGKWEAIEPGHPSPDFQAFDIEGKVYKLEDFRGKYVYIDIWATWCVPCRAEIPHLEALIGKYQDIAFVSISCDNNMEAWKKMVNGGMVGNQLHFCDGDSFMDSYFITTIPRFILIDPEGKIVSSDMTLPSDPQTAASLDALLK